MALVETQGWEEEEGAYGRVQVEGPQGRPVALAPLPHLPLLPPGTPMALKQLPKASTSLRAFLYEFCVGLSLGTHPAIVAAYGIGIESANSYSFLTEPVLHGDLIAFIQPKVSRRVVSRPPRASWGLTETPMSDLGLRNHTHCVGPHQASHSPPEPLTGQVGLTELLVLSGVH